MHVSTTFDYSNIVEHIRLSRSPVFVTLESD